MGGTILTKDAKWWEREIKRKSTRYLDKLIYAPIILLICVIAFAGYIYAYLPQGGKILEFEITQNVARLITYTVTIVSVIGITLSGIWKFRHPSFIRYLYVALDIINDLEGASEEKKTQMRDIVNETLECCTDPNMRKECNGALKECSTKLAGLSTSPPQPHTSQTS